MEKTANQELFDQQVEHLLVVRRYEESVKNLIEKAGSRHRTFLERILKKDPSDEKALRSEVQRYIGELHSTANTGITDYIGAELDFQTNALNRVTKDFYAIQSVNRGELSKVITSTPLRLGSQSYNTLANSFEGLARAEFTQLNSLIRRGIAQGKDESLILAEVMKASKIPEQHARTLVQTNLAHAEQLVKEKVVEANKDIVSGFIFTAILDARTSKTCSSYDGLFQSPDNVNVRPPLHYNCRSKLVPLIKPKAELSKSTSPRINQNAVAQLSDAVFGGGLPAKESFREWLLRQSMATQAKHLGSEEKAELFQRGTLSIADFFSRGKPVSIGTLRTLDNQTTWWGNGFFQRNREPAPTLSTVDRPSRLLNNKALQKQLEDLYVQDTMSANQAIALTDYRGTTLAGKRSTRHRTFNEFDERNTSFDPFTGETRSTLVYDPDFTLYQERLDYMKASKGLRPEHKDFIEKFVEGLEDRVSVNQQSAIVENLRVLFERHAKTGEPWQDFAKAVRAEMNYSVINTSQLLDTRSRKRAELFLRFSGDASEPAVMIGADRVTLRELSEDKLKYERYVAQWDRTVGRPKARELYYSFEAPWRAYLFKPDKKPDSLSEKLWDSFTKNQIKKIFYKDNPTEFYSRYGKTPPKVKKILQDWVKKQVTPKWHKAIKDINKEGLQNMIERTVREKYRSIVDLEFMKERNLPILFEKTLTNQLRPIEGEVVRTLSRLMAVVGEGTTTDYDSLAILLGKELRSRWKPVVPFMGSSLEDYHREGSRILEHLREQKMIRVSARGVTRRSTIDIDTGRVSGNFKDTVSREVQILDKDMLELQKANRIIELSNRIGVDRPRNKYYAVAGKKNYVDARGNDSGVPLITRSANAHFDEKQFDKDFADMLNHTMSFEYEVDKEFASFMDDIARFRDSRGNAKYYDSINAFREEIVRRGDQGYGLLETVRYYLSNGRKFSAHARIDGRGRVYYNGYLTPTGGEVIRPFLNTAKSVPMTPGGLHQIKIQMGAVIGPSSEALTDAGRLAIFARNEKAILEIGELFTHKTQRERRLREFLEHPLIQATDGAEVAKIARFSLEYYRIHKHTGGKFSDPFTVDSTGIISDSNRKVFGKITLKKDQVDWVATNSSAAANGLSTVLTRHNSWPMKTYLDPLDTNSTSVAKTLGFKPSREKDDKGRVLWKLEEADFTPVNSLSTYRSQLVGESDASASGLQMVALATGDRGAAVTSNVLQSRQKNRIYDLVKRPSINRVNCWNLSMRQSAAKLRSGDL